MRSLLCFLLVLCFLGEPAAASSFVAMSRAELVAESASVIEGTVLETKAYWNNERTLIWTEVVLQVDDRLKGESPGLVRVQTPGGQIGDFHIEAVGFPTFEAGERFVVFLRQEGERVRVTGSRQGQYRIEKGADGAAMAVPAAGPEVLLIGRDGRRAAPAEPLLLDSLKNEIREAVRQPEETP